MENGAAVITKRFCTEISHPNVKGDENGGAKLPTMQLVISRYLQDELNLIATQHTMAKS